MGFLQTLFGRRRSIWRSGYTCGRHARGDLSNERCRSEKSGPLAACQTRSQRLLNTHGHIIEARRRKLLEVLFKRGSHYFPRSTLTCPDFKLRNSLLEQHLRSRYHGTALCLGSLQE